VVTVRGKLSVEDLTDTNTKRGGSHPIHPDIPNNCSDCLGYLRNQFWVGQKKERHWRSNV